MSKHLVSCCTLLFFVLSLRAQESPASDSLPKASILLQYNNIIQQQQRLYNGVEHAGYSPKIKGHAYLYHEWQNGSVLYDGVYYKDIPILYDLYKDQVIVKHYNNFYIIGLVSPKVSSFTLAGQRFQRVQHDTLVDNIKAGFYEVLTEGKLMVLAKRTKNLLEYIHTTLEYEFKQQNQYLVRKDGVYHIIRNEGRLFDLFGNHRSQVKQYLRKNDLRYKKDPEQTIVKAVEYYESLNK